MSAENTTTLIGNASRDAELRFTASGRAVANFSMAVNRRWKNNTTDEWEEQVSFFNVVVWGDQAENVASSVTKGARVMVAGRLEQRSWETKEGDKRSTIEVIADEVGTSLKWATVDVHRNERREGSGNSKPQASSKARQEEYSEEPF